MMLFLSVLAAAIWGVIAVLPWQPHRYRERIAAREGPLDLSDITVLVPARNEAQHIERTLRALSTQGPGLDITIIDDSSTDGTAELAEKTAASLAEPNAAEPAAYAARVRILRGAPLPDGWGGKLWALQQGLAEVTRPYVLLLDADIELEPHTLPALLDLARQRDAQLVSVMATLHCESFWEKLLVPPFVFFFKLLYPFALVQSPKSQVAAAAGGCILVETRALRQIDAFDSLRDALIDDCTLAALLKRETFGLWLGVSHCLLSHRRYAGLADFWRMVARTAFTQLRYSFVLLMLTTALLFALFVVPILGMTAGYAAPAFWLGAAALLLMYVVFAPTARFYGLGIVWIVSLPAAAVLYLCMTWSSALNYWRGTRAQWKSRSYGVPSK